MQVLASFTGTVVYAGENCVFSGPILVEQQRDDADAGTESFDIALSYDSARYDAIVAQVRHSGSVVKLGQEATTLLPPGDPAPPHSHGTTPPDPPPFDTLIIGRGLGLTVEDVLDTTQQATMEIVPVGDLWAVPSHDPDLEEPSTCPPPPAPATAAGTPRLLGNKPTTVDLLLGVSPQKMQTFRLFQGQTFQKQTKGTSGIAGSLSCVDDSLLYADVPLCYELQPFSGLHRGEIVKQLATAVGIPLEKVFVPVGGIVNKPMLLSNESFMPFLADFIAPENWYAHFDENGNLIVEPIERKNAPLLPDWTLDESKGDFDLDNFEETPPSKPGTRYFVIWNEVVRGTGPGGNPLEQTTRTTEEISDIYNPQCVKVRPSGAASNLFGDGSYRALLVSELMVISRKITEITTRDGIEVKRLVTNYGFYNPAAYDPNFDTDPPGSSYDGAYGDQSFHRDEVESLMEISEDTIITSLDVNGTILGTVETTKGWYAPHRAATFPSGDRTKIINDAGATPPSYVYAGGSARIQTAETYLVTSKVETSYFYSPDGTLGSKVVKTSGYYSPDSRCDLVNVTTDPDTGPPSSSGNPDTPPWEFPPPTPPPTPPPGWYPSLVGPVAQTPGEFGARFVFLASISGGNLTGGVFPAQVSAKFCSAAGPLPPLHGAPSGPGSSLGTTGPDDLGALTPGGEEQAQIAIEIGGPRPSSSPYLVYVWFAIPSGRGSTHLYSNTIVFDPWASVPPGGSL